jgi:hypothetical protein
MKEFFSLFLCQTFFSEREGVIVTKKEMFLKIVEYNLGRFESVDVIETIRFQIHERII